MINYLVSEVLVICLAVYLYVCFILAGVVNPHVALIFVVLSACFMLLVILHIDNGLRN